MTKFTSKLLLKKKGMFTFISFLVLCSSLMSDNAFSRQKWNRNYIQVKYDHADNSIYIKIKFFHYEFGPFGEHGYLEWLEIDCSLEDRRYLNLMRCEVLDQIYKDYSWVQMKNKLFDANIVFYGFETPKSGVSWPNFTPLIGIIVKNNSKEASFIIKWSIPNNVKVKYIMVLGIWYVNGLNCKDVIAEKYTEDDVSEFDIPKMIASKPVKKDILQNDQFENNAVKVYNETDAVVIKGTYQGENIRVYTTSGTQINATIANNDVVKIKLPANQIYFVLVGQSRYKVAL